MSGLPRHISPWAAQLALFPDEIASALGGWLLRLSNLLGHRPLAAAGAGTPDGYDGIAGRGPYERLLPSEWLLLDELPEEFLRRAVSGEQAFLRQAYVERAAGRRCVALFDAGVEQLGAPRLVQLALLILLDRRAQLQRLELEWGVLQDARMRLYEALNVDTVRALLASRCLRSGTAGDVDRWRALLEAPGRRGGAQGEISELWLVGSEALAPCSHALRATAIAISDVLEPGTPRRVRACASGLLLERERTVILELPNDPLGIELLRDPFRVAAPPRAAPGLALDLRSELVFSADGRRLFVRGSGASLATFVVPNSTRVQVGAPANYRAPDGHQLLGVGRFKRSIVLTQLGDELFLHKLTKRDGEGQETRRCTSIGERRLPEASDQTLLPIAAIGSEAVCFVHANGWLIELIDGQCRLVNVGAIAARVLKRGLAWVTLAQGVPQIAWACQSLAQVGVQINPVKMPKLPAQWGPPLFFFGYVFDACYAYATGPGCWILVRGESSSTIELSDAHTVVGIVGARPGLLALDRTRQELLFLQPGTVEPLLRVSSPIAQFQVSPNGSDVAYLTLDGELGVYSAPRKAHVARWKGTALP